MQAPRLILRLLALLALFAAAACQQSIPPSGFDPRAEADALEDPDFRTVRLDRSLDGANLRPSLDPYRLGPGDIVEIEVSEVPGTLARTFVMPDGLVHYNLAGGVRAEGLTVSEFSDALTTELRRDYANPLVNVSLVEVRSRRYWILGRVYKPGIYPLRQPTTLLEAVSQAGGLFASRFSGTTEELADLSNSVLIRDGEILPVDFERLIREGDTSQNVYLRHNDFVYLPSVHSATVLLLGAVNEPKSLGFRGSLSLVESIALGRGLSPDAYPQRVVIVRGSHREPSAATVDLREILAGGATDVRLRPGDIVWVPRRPFGLLESTVELIFRDAARTIAINEGARAVGSSQQSIITVPAGGAP